MVRAGSLPIFSSETGLSVETMRKSIAVVALSLALSLWAGLTVAADSLTLAIPLPLTGKQAKFGEIERRAYEIALEEINAQGGIKGRQLVLRFEDSQGKPEKARYIAEKLINVDKQPVLFGEYNSSCSKAMATVAEGRKVPCLVVTGAADGITRQKNTYVYRLCPPNAFYSIGLMSFMEQVVRPESMAILYESSDFGISGAEEMARSAQAAGIRVLVNERYEKGAVDFKPVLSRVKDADPDIIYMVSYVMDASLLMRQIMELDIEAKLFAGGAAGFAIPEFIENAGKASEYVVTASLWSPQLPYKGAREFAEKYTIRYGTSPSYHGAEAYAALYVIKDVLERAASLSPEDINTAMKATNLETAFGPVRFVDADGYQNQNFLDTYMLQVLNGRHETVWPEKYASARYVYPIPRWGNRF